MQESRRFLKYTEELQFKFRQSSRSLKLPAVYLEPAVVSRGLYLPTANPENPNKFISENQADQSQASNCLVYPPASSHHQGASIWGVFSHVLPHACCSAEEEGLASLTLEEAHSELVGSWASVSLKLVFTVEGRVSVDLYIPPTHTHTHCLKTLSHVLGLVRVRPADL